MNVHYREEELSQSFRLETCSDPSVSSVSEICDRENPNEEIRPCSRRKRKAACLSDSDMDTTTVGEPSKQCHTSIMMRRKILEQIFLQRAIIPGLKKCTIVIMAMQQIHPR